MRSRFVAASLLLAVLLTGCSVSEPQQDIQISETLPPDTSAAGIPETGTVQETVPEETAPGLVYYVTDHGTVNAADTSKFLADITDEAGYTLKTDVLAAVPIDADAVILNAPSEDITPEELDILDSYMDEGGHVLFLMPADGREMRYKYLERFLEEYCFVMDYDLLTETTGGAMLGGDAEFLQIEEIGVPDGMPQPAEGMPVYQHQVRSFHFVFGDNYSAIKQDAMLETYHTAIGTPFGGTEDDPLSYEGEQLVTMLYSRNDQRRNSTIVAAGSADFLLDENYDAESSEQMKKWVFATLFWFTSFLS